MRSFVSEVKMYFEDEEEEVEKVEVRAVVTVFESC